MGARKVQAFSMRQNVQASLKVCHANAKGNDMSNIETFIREDGVAVRVESVATNAEELVWIITGLLNNGETVYSESVLVAELEKYNWRVERIRNGLDKHEVT